jgi:iron complex transport system substrate-binding protein
LVITDDRGRTIELAGPAEAIVTLGASALEGLFAIGAGNQVVGREEYSIYPEEALAVTNIGSLFGELPAEAILALEPDLVIAPEIISREQVQALDDLGLVVYWQANPRDFPGLFSNLMVLAQLSGHETEAETLVKSLENRIQQVEATIAAADMRPTVFYELDATDPDNPYTTGAGTFIDTIIFLAGGENIGQVLEGEYAQISAEEIILQDPEIIILGDAPYGVTADTVAARAGWAGLQAVVGERVFPFDPFLVSVPGPRLVDGLESMARLLHPELFD